MGRSGLSPPNQEILKTEMTQKRATGRNDQRGRKKSKRVFAWDTRGTPVETFQEVKWRANPEEKLGNRKCKK